MRVLHIGCGRKRYTPEQLFQYVGLTVDDIDTATVEVIHLDADKRLAPDVVCTLGVDIIPLDTDSIDLIIGWHVLEHIGRQGEADGWFQAWEEFYRVLKPNGWLYAESPYYHSIWAWSDPTHTRALSEHSLLFFMQDAYRQRNSMISPYRIACDFAWLGMTNLEKGFALLPDPQEPRNVALRFALVAKKPLTPWWED
jgi:SAM-dependent methyltransferase